MISTRFQQNEHSFTQALAKRIRHVKIFFRDFFKKDLLLILEKIHKMGRPHPIPNNEQGPC